MPFPAQGADKFFKGGPQSQGWLEQLLFLTGVIFAVCLFLWLGLRFGYEPFLNSKIAKLDDKIQQFSQQVSVADQQSIANFYSQFQNLKALLQNHVFVTPLFEWLEKNVEQKVYFSRLSYNPKLQKLVVAGSARTGNDLVAQLQILQAQTNVDKVLFDTASVSASGTWTFGFTVLFNAPFPGLPTDPGPAATVPAAP